MVPLFANVITSAIVGGGATAIIFVIAGVIGPVPRCPECGVPRRGFRKPASWSQFFWGGWTCACCGCEVDRRGRKLPSV
jgi:hypothetical protein